MDDRPNLTNDPKYWKNIKLDRLHFAEGGWQAIPHLKVAFSLKEIMKFEQRLDKAIDRILKLLEDDKNQHIEPELTKILEFLDKRYFSVNVIIIPADEVQNTIEEKDYNYYPEEEVPEELPVSEDKKE